MKKTNFSIRFYLGDHDAKKVTTIYLYIRFYKDGESERSTYKFRTPYKVFPKDWNKTDDCLKSSAAGQTKINAALQNIKSGVMILWADANIEKMDLTIVDLNQKIKSILDKFKTETTEIKIKDSSSEFQKAFEAYKKYLHNTKRRTTSTINKYNNTKRLLDFYSYHTGKVISFETLDFNFYSDFVTYLYDNEHDVPQSMDKRQRGKIKMKTNSVYKIIKTLKGFLKHSQIHGVTKEMHYQQFTVISEDVEKIALTKNDLELLKNVDLSEYPKLDATRDFFLFTCYTGQRYNDVASIQWDDIKGKDWQNADKKTSDKRLVKLLPEALMILNKYKKSMLPIPRISNPELNKDIKIVARMAGLTEKIKITEIIRGEKVSNISAKCDLITSHTARRTFITLAAKNGMRQEIGMKMTGHKDSRTYQKYNKISPEMIEEELYKAFA